MDRNTVGMIQSDKIDIPSDAAAFLHAMHDQHVIGDKQSMRNGTAGFIPFDTRSKPMRKLIHRMTNALSGMLGTKDWGYVGLWSTRLPKGGYHVEHNHPKGWMSGTCYVDVPESPSGGLLVFRELVDEIIPATGNVVVFPSGVLHSVCEYWGERPRLAVSFDILKLKAVA